MKCRRCWYESNKTTSYTSGLPNEINSIDTESNIPAIKAMVDLDRRIRESILEKKYDKIKEQTIKQEEAENINADSIRKDMNREFID